MDAIDWLLASQLPAIKNKKIRRLREEVLRNLDSEISFTTFVEKDTDASMTIESAEDIINRLPDGDFRLELIFIKQKDDKWFVEHGKDPIKASNKKNLFILNKNTAPGALVGIDSLFYDASYPVTVVIYAGYKIKVPDANKLSPMRHPGNCVAKLVKDFFSDAARGGQLTDARRNAIRHWERSVQRSGATIAAIKKLEFAIKRPRRP